MSLSVLYVGVCFCACVQKKKKKYESYNHLHEDKIGQVIKIVFNKKLKMLLLESLGKMAGFV